MLSYKSNHITIHICIKSACYTLNLQYMSRNVKIKFKCSTSIRKDAQISLSFIAVTAEIIWYLFILGWQKMKKTGRPAPLMGVKGATGAKECQSLCLRKNRNSSWSLACQQCGLQGKLEATHAVLDSADKTSSPKRRLGAPLSSSTTGLRPRHRCLQIQTPPQTLEQPALPG